ncbi:hypothetical protein CMUS01_09695 [Colletotrichum musicola]|uniref:Uncharacterized protein n=1 Tax=Colletotrichum musicola TaxID=2175873 RepID=A0A8H6K763_9PEZI|nr:hypothetical protein CMUS01_09695 [Colletotrichum musicola]
MKGLPPHNDQMNALPRYPTPSLVAHRRAVPRAPRPAACVRMYPSEARRVYHLAACFMPETERPRVSPPTKHLGWLALPATMSTEYTKHSPSNSSGAASHQLGCREAAFSAATTTWQLMGSPPLANMPQKAPDDAHLAAEASGSTTFLSLDRRCAATMACVPNRSAALRDTIPNARRLVSTPSRPVLQSLVPSPENRLVDVEQGDEGPVGVSFRPSQRSVRSTSSGWRGRRRSSGTPFGRVKPGSPHPVRCFDSSTLPLPTASRRRFL